MIHTPDGGSVPADGFDLSLDGCSDEESDQDWCSDPGEEELEDEEE